MDKYYLTPDSNVRYNMLTSDHATLYCKYSRMLGLDVTIPPKYNIDNWLDPDSPDFNPFIRENISHYTARTEAGEQFEVCINTLDMDNMAWKHCHHAQLILDGTFGVCTEHLLLFIALTVNPQTKKGLPIVLFMFSAPTGNQATHAGYNIEILWKLLQGWKDHLTWYRLQLTHPIITVHPYLAETFFITAEKFKPYSVITDTDYKEQGALLQVWPLIILCLFHLKQCWKNSRKRHLGSCQDFWKCHVWDRLYSLECQLISTTNHSVVTILVYQEHTYLTTLLNEASSKAAAQGGLTHVAYLNKNWMSENMWHRWSDWSRIAASAQIGIPVESILPTTNHLESFNAILKWKHLASWLHLGHRLHFDFLIFILIT
ncbi:hypothetical protein Moror_9272 [Moniliophthora roreri MCA 2997]|uniref:MULE transposase domain-containing protein n=2 Tax=Moniliophthora roreri TaxID=221103 RepID=V2X167_MONRO|nr:hypothetical protein Moror_9272 [Moniliophthora roreri MCA 2997]